MEKLTIDQLLEIANTIGQQPDPIDEDALPTIDELLAIAEKMTN